MKVQINPLESKGNLIEEGGGEWLI
jgi:hypothetical protein